MDNFLGTIVFLLPGVLAYFWLQAFGINPVVKHSPTEFTAVAGLLWLPIAFGTLIMYNVAIWLSGFIYQVKPIWTLQTLKDASNSFTFLIAFLLLSVLVSYIFTLAWALWGFNVQQILINWVRVKRRIAKLSPTPAVWDEVFLKNELQYIKIEKMDKKDKDNDDQVLIGRALKVSRPFEPDRCFCIDLIEEVSKVVEKYEIDVKNIFVDVRAGIIIKTFDAPQVSAALEDIKNSTSSLVAPEPESQS